MEKGAQDQSSSNLLKISEGNLVTAARDDDLKQIFRRIKASKDPTIINYGASWCRACSQILPAFCQLSSKFPKLSFVYADFDECPESTQHIRYTPTFHFYRTVKGWMRCSAPEKSVCTTACGCILEGKKKAKPKSIRL